MQKKTTKNLPFGCIGVLTVVVGFVVVVVAAFYILIKIKHKLDTA